MVASSLVVIGIATTPVPRVTSHRTMLLRIEDGLRDAVASGGRSPGMTRPPERPFAGYWLSSMVVTECAGKV